MLKSIEIENFKKIKHLKLDQLAPINYLVGENGSGKSSVLEIFNFIELLSDAELNKFKFSDNVISFHNQINSVVGSPYTDKMNIYDILRSLFKENFKVNLNFNELIENIEEIKLEIDLELTSLEANQFSFYFDSVNENSKNSIKEYQQSVRKINLNSLNTFYTETGLFRNYNYASSEYSNIDFKNSSRKYFNSVISKLFEKEQNLVFSISENDTGKMICNLNDEVVDFYRLANGIKLMYAIDRVFNQSLERDEGNLIIFIDEPEIGLHPKIQKNLVNTFQEYYQKSLKKGKNIQFFICTHSPFIISAAANLPDQKVYLIDEGQTKDAETGELNTDRSKLGYGGYQAKETANKMLGVGLEDVMNEVIFCEGSQILGKNHEFDAKIYNNIFNQKGYLFVSAGGGDITQSTKTTMKITSKFFKKFSHKVIKDSDLLSITDKEAKIQEFKNDGLDLIYLEKQCIESYLLDISVVDKYFEVLEIVPGDDFNTAWNEYDLVNIKNTEHKISDKLVNLVRQEIYSHNKYSFSHNDIYLALAKIIKEEFGKEKLRNDPDNIYWQLHDCVFGSK